MKKNETRENRIRIFATLDSAAGGLNLILDFSGRQEFVAYRQYNDFLYSFLRSGVRLDILRRMSAKDWIRVGGKHMIPVGRYLVKVIDSYLADRAAEEAFDFSSLRVLPENDYFGLSA